MLETLKIGFKKFKRLPKHQLYSRLVMGIKKYVTDYPTSISVQTVSACNLKCKHCFINDYQTHIHDGVTKIMKFNEFVLFVERLKPLIKKASIFYFSTFEAILNKNLFKKMELLMEINPKIKFPFLSNGMELTIEKIEQLQNYPVPEINISLDGCTKEVVENFKTEVVFETVIATIKNLRQSKLTDKVAVTFVAHKNNIHQLPDYVDFVHGLGVKNIYVSNILSFTKELAHLPLYTKNGNQEAASLFEEAVRRAKINHQILALPELAPHLKGCQAVESFFVDINGNVSPCDFLAVTTPFTLWGKTVQNPPVIMGNVFKEDPLAIYRSQQNAKFRRAHRLAKDIPSPCENCIDAYGLMCSNRKVYYP